MTAPRSKARHRAGPDRPAYVRPTATPAPPYARFERYEPCTTPLPVYTVNEGPVPPVVRIDRLALHMVIMADALTSKAMLGRHREV